MVRTRNDPDYAVGKCYNIPKNYKLPNSVVLKILEIFIGSATPTPLPALAHHQF